MKKFRRILSFGMMVCLLLALLPVNVLAAHDSTGRPTDLTGNVYLSVYNGTEFPGEPAEHDVSEYTHLTPELTVGNSTTVYAGSAETVLKSTVLEDVVEGTRSSSWYWTNYVWGVYNAKGNSKHFFHIFTPSICKQPTAVFLHSEPLINQHKYKRNGKA